MRIDYAYKEFIEDKKYKFLSKESIRNYDTFILNTFIKGHVGTEKDTHDMTVMDYNSYVIKLRDNDKLSTATVKTYAANARVFLNYCYENELLEFDPLRKCKLPKAVRKVKEIYDDDEIYMIFKAIKTQYGKNTFSYRRLMLIYAIMLDTGARANEILSMNLGDFNYDKGFIKFTGHKTHQERMVPVCRATCKMYMRYLDVRPEPINAPPKDRKALFVSNKLRRLRHDSLRRYSNTYIKKIAGINRGTNHLFRHTFATRMIFHGVSLIEVQELMGHCENSRITRDYVRYVSQMRIVGQEYENTADILMKVLEL